MITEPHMCITYVYIYVNINTQIYIYILHVIQIKNNNNSQWDHIMHQPWIPNPNQTNSTNFVNLSIHGQLLLLLLKMLEENHVLRWAGGKSITYPLYGYLLKVASYIISATSGVASSSEVVFSKNLPPLRCATNTTTGLSHEGKMTTPFRWVREQNSWRLW